MKKLFIISLLLSGAVLSACNSGGSSTPEPTPIPTPTPIPIGLTSYPAAGNYSGTASSTTAQDSSIAACNFSGGSGTATCTLVTSSGSGSVSGNFILNSVTCFSGTETLPYPYGTKSFTLSYCSIYNNGTLSGHYQNGFGDAGSFSASSTATPLKLTSYPTAGNYSGTASSTTGQGASVATCNVLYSGSATCTLATSSGRGSVSGNFILNSVTCLSGTETLPSPYGTKSFTLYNCSYKNGTLSGHYQNGFGDAGSFTVSLTAAPVGLTSYPTAGNYSGTANSTTGQGTSVATCNVSSSGSSATCSLVSSSGSGSVSGNFILNSVTCLSGTETLPYPYGTKSFMLYNCSYNNGTLIGYYENGFGDAGRFTASLTAAPVGLTSYPTAGNYFGTAISTTGQGTSVATCNISSGGYGTCTLVNGSGSGSVSGNFILNSVTCFSGAGTPPSGGMGMPFTLSNCSYKNGTLSGSYGFGDAGSLTVSLR